MTALPPGKRAFPAHNHHANEEMFFVPQGAGELRVGDVLACPPGGKVRARQIINTGTEALPYMAVRTKRSPELVEYPGYGKFAVLSELPASADGKPQRFMIVGRARESLDYREDE
jgi:uncharacterized cupin superfamily protein